MKKDILYFDIIGGISGDMTLASLLDLGVPKEIFLQELNKLNMDNEFEIEIDYKYENGNRMLDRGLVVPIACRERESYFRELVCELCQLEM